MAKQTVYIYKCSKCGKVEQYSKDSAFIKCGRCNIYMYKNGQQEIVTK